MNTISLPTREPSAWFPLFEFQDWVYQSHLLLPDSEDPAATAVKAKPWAQGRFVCGQAMAGFTLTGDLIFGSGLELAVSASGTPGVGTSPGTFSATATGLAGATRGAVYELTGWVFPELPILNAAARVFSVRGSVRAVLGADGRPAVELGGMPLGTVGSFVISRAA